MTQQLSFSEVEYNLKKRKTPREEFLEQMDALLTYDEKTNIAPGSYLL